LTPVLLLLSKIKVSSKALFFENRDLEKTEDSQLLAVY
jgi:hypothetical protein